MTALYLVRLPVNLRAFHTWSAERGLGWASRHDGKGHARVAAFDEGRALHHLLAETFGKSVLQPFRLFVPPKQSQANLYAYSAASKDELVETVEACAMPETLGIYDVSRLDAKRMPDSWREGRRLGFETRVRPARRLAKSCGLFSKGAEVDAFLIDAMRRFPEGPPPEEEDRLKREPVYAAWLAERLGAAVKIEKVRLTEFQRRRIARENRSLVGPDATLQGDLTILDPDAFQQILVKGVGRHAAYGFGMLLIRPGGQR